MINCELADLKSRWNHRLVWFILIAVMVAQSRIVLLLLMAIMFVCSWIFIYIIELSNNVNYLLKEVQEMELQLINDGKINYEGANVDNGRKIIERDVLPVRTRQQAKDSQMVPTAKESVPTILAPNDTKNSNKTKIFKMPIIEGINVISMTLWGSDGRYTNGALRNAELIKRFFPGWTLRIYTEKRTPGSALSPKHPVVPMEVLDRLRSLGADIEYVDPREINVPAMMWRFLIADDLSVDHFIIRDTDGRLSSRDAAAVYQWILSGKPFGCIRDHPSHSGYSISGGLWGGKPSGLRDIFRRPFKEIMFGYKDDYFQDMKFLIDIVWPRVQAKAFCSDSFSCDKFTSSHPFPVPRHGYEFVGEVYDAEGMRRPSDTTLLRQAGVNDLCVPPDDLN